MQNSKSETSMLCKHCGSVKQTRFCEVCNRETNTHFTKEFTDTISLLDSAKNLMKSGEKANGKSKREIEQYVGNRDQRVVSEFERLREYGKPTRVIHRLWRRIGNVFKKVHEHDK